MKKTRYLTFCAIMAALGVVILFLASFIEWLDLTAVIVASAFVFVTAEELGKKSIAVYAVTAVISLLILPSKLVALEYLLLGGYPIIKIYLDKLPAVVRNVVKIIYMLIADCMIVWLTNFIFTGDGAEERWFMLAIFVLLGLVCFAVYDIALSRLARFYRVKLRKQLRIDRFFKK